MNSKRFDVIVHGATGYMGHLVLRALLSDPDSAVGAPNALKWAMAGRNEQKLKDTKEQLKAFPEVDAATIDAVPMLIADSMNETDLVNMVKKAKVVLSLAGPYKLYGETMVKVCAEHGIHYCDLTGETYWIRAMVDKYDAIAQKTGAKIVNCCGFDSVPSDLAVLLLAEAVRKTRNSATSKVKVLLTDMKGGVGGATIYSRLTFMGTATRAQLEAFKNPFHLTDEATMTDKQQRGLVQLNAATMSSFVTKEPEIHGYSSLFFMTGCNQAIVHRSNYLLGNQYGDAFVYRERLAKGGWFVQIIVSLVMTIVNLMFAFEFTRNKIASRVPPPGTGPTEEVLQDGVLEIQAFAYDANHELAAKLRVFGAGDPGYFLTGKMIAECAKCLSKDETSERGNKGGLLTPASAFGSLLSDRLARKNIFKFDLETL